MSVSDFLPSAAQDRARQVLAGQELLAFTERDWNAIAAALETTDRPRPKLAAAMQRHRDGRHAQRSAILRPSWRLSSTCSGFTPRLRERTA
jgi:hypothetical protein